MEEPAWVVGASVTSVKLPTQLGMPLSPFLSTILSPTGSASPSWLATSSLVRSQHAVGQVLESDIQEFMGVAEIEVVMLMNPFSGSRIIADDSQL